MNSVRRFVARVSLAATLFCTGFALSAPVSLAAQSPAMTKPPAAIYKVATSNKVLALTFDISWGDKAPGPILDILQAKHVTKATFFLSGPWVLHHQEIAKRIKAMGFEIGSHGHMHKNYSEHTDTWVREQVQKSEQAIKDVLGVKTTLIRTPNGDFNKHTIQVLNQMGYTVIQWNTDSLDWMNPGVEQIKQRVLTRCIPGDIILMHASDSCKQTHLALPAIIDGLRAKGYQFATVSELISGANVHSTVQ
ncbi:MAG: polysaccharide deacetylase family sporulation protein PdaB [Acidibacillus sp.]|uniref:Peptidoglycan-N-acetylglucosamine deacetylase n=1 Tax=Sulfoacidibacillus ferrooxidans TaxID=2005001 RepID=A0A9X1VCU4_9BACL|nr:polysaccharide deacetylase family sporulation protein PdaB [Sulfoacidibacillus ferrooxidans]MCI0183808.1 Peptidoglycan-N-acetylglucosamine deacetylase [Sulfoacidibacillus ferrooxidans]MCY0893669.1 polysaccharide deacetylase family sporulation protein PdaB [Acidibacillus sp.]